MSKKAKQDRLLTLQELAAFGSLTKKEEKEMSSLAIYLNDIEGPKATDEQLEYIQDLVNELGVDLEDYTNIDLEDLNVEIACEVIDALKEDRDNEY